jgi:hypothetical protein
MEDDLEKFKIGRRPRKIQNWKTTSKFSKLEDDLNLRRIEDNLAFLEIEDDLKNFKTNPKNFKTQNLFPIPLKFRGKTFLGLAQLSKIFILFLGSFLEVIFQFICWGCLAIFVLRSIF